MGCIIAIFVIFFSLHFGKIYYQPSNGNVVYKTAFGETIDKMTIFTAFALAMESINEDPLAITPFYPQTILAMFIMLGFLMLVVLYAIFSAERNSHFAFGKENGSAKWNDGKKFNKKFVDKEIPGHISTNMIFSEDVKASMNGRKTRMNNNCTIIGGAGQGKSRFEIKPNILQMNCSFAVTDPSGELLKETGRALIANGINIKLFSTSDMSRSNHYNPFDYVFDEEGKVDENKVASMVYAFVKNGNEMGKKGGGDPFWEKSAKAFISAIVFYLLETQKKENQNFYNVLKMTQQAAPDDNPRATSSNPLDSLFQALEKSNPNSRAVSNYKTFKLAGAKTASSILISAAVDLNIFGQNKVKALTSTNTKFQEKNLELDKLGDVQTALFINIPQADGTFNFLVSMMYTQLFAALYSKAEKISPNRFNVLSGNNWPLRTMFESKGDAESVAKKYRKAVLIEEKRSGEEFLVFKCGDEVLKEFQILLSGNKSEDEKQRTKMRKKAEVELKGMHKAKVKRGSLMLPWHIRCLMDEFANIGEVPEFSEKLATMRKYNISCTIVLQNLAQLKNRYDKLWEGILGTCSFIVFLGSSEMETAEYISKMLGKMTIVIRNNSRSMSSKGGNSGLTYNRSARDLMDPSEVRKLDGDYCIVFAGNNDPFYSLKYRYEKHPYFSLTGDCNSDFNIDVDYLNQHYFIDSGEKKEAQRIRIRELVESKRELASNNKTMTGEDICSEPKIIKSKEELVQTIKEELPFPTTVSDEDVMGVMIDNGLSDEAISTPPTDAFFSEVEKFRSEMEIPETFPI